MKTVTILGLGVVLASTIGVVQAAPTAKKGGIRVVAGAKTLTKAEKGSVDGRGGYFHWSNRDYDRDRGRGHKGWDNDCNPKPPYTPPPCAPPPCTPPCTPPPSVPPS